jgi:putative redox protein
MVQIKASIGLEPYKIEIKSPSGNILIADEPVTSGGKNTGFSPKELLASALASCTCATLRMYAERKGWNLPQVDISMELSEEEGKTTFNRKLHFHGNLDADQRKRLLTIANLCPVHKILTNTIEIHTDLS